MTNFYKMRGLSQLLINIWNKVLGSLVLGFFLAACNNSNQQVDKKAYIPQMRQNGFVQMANSSVGPVSRTTPSNNIQSSLDQNQSGNLTLSNPGPQTVSPSSRSLPTPPNKLLDSTDEDLDSSKGCNRDTTGRICKPDSRSTTGNAPHVYTGDITPVVGGGSSSSSVYCRVQVTTGVSTTGGGCGEGAVSAPVFGVRPSPSSPRSEILTRPVAPNQFLLPNSEGSVVSCIPFENWIGRRSLAVNTEVCRQVPEAKILGLLDAQKIILCDQGRITDEIYVGIGIGGVGFKDENSALRTPLGAYTLKREASSERGAATQILRMQPVTKGLAVPTSAYIYKQRFTSADLNRVESTLAQMLAGRSQTDVKTSYGIWASLLPFLSAGVDMKKRGDALETGRLNPKRPLTDSEKLRLMEEMNVSMGGIAVRTSAEFARLVNFVDHHPDAHMVVYAETDVCKIGEFPLNKTSLKSDSKKGPSSQKSHKAAPKSGNVSGRSKVSGMASGK